MGLARLGRAARSILSLNRMREFRHLTRMLELGPGDTLLDVGSGDGFWTARFAGLCSHVTALEPDKKLLSLACELHQRPNVKYVRGCAETLPFPDSTFDKVVSVSCLEHFADPMRGLHEMTRILKPGGRIALSVDSLLAENSAREFREWHSRRHFVTSYFSEDVLLGMMKDAGLQFERRRTVHLFRSRVAAKVRRAVIRYPRLSLPMFPVLYGVVVTADTIGDDMHGQIIIVAGRADQAGRGK